VGKLAAEKHVSSTRIGGLAAGPAWQLVAAVAPTKMKEA